MPKLFLLDLDHTLFDTEHLKTDVAESLLTVVQDQKQVEDFFAIEKSNRSKPFYIQEATRQFCEKYHFTDKCQNIYNCLLDHDFSTYIFPDVPSALTQLRQLGKVAIFTTGDSLFQQVKVHQSQLAQQVDFLFIYDDKLLHLDELVKQFANQEIWYVDNHLDLLSPAHDIAPQINTVWMNRDARLPENNFQPTLAVKNLTEFTNHIEQQ